MEQSPQVMRSRRAGGALLLAILLVTTGCVGLDGFTTKQKGPPKEGVYKVVATWIPQVINSPDSTRNGRPTPCLAGRIYLFGAEINHTVGADGSLTVDLYDPSVVDPQTHEPKQLEQWNIDVDTLNQKFLKEDMFGWGYTLALPWSTYRPDVTRVELRVRYQPKVGSPLFADPASVTLAGQGDQPMITQAANVKH